MVVANRLSVHHAFSVFTVMMLFLFASVNTAFAAEFVAGKDYKELAVQDKMEGSQIIVREFFWYGCPHCYNLEPYVQAWEKTKPADVTFLHTPAPLNPVWEVNARGYYAAQKLGVANKTHTALLHAIHQNGQRLYSKDSLAKFYAGFGADSNQFKQLYHSPAVDQQVQHARESIVRYKISGVPALVVNGQYVVGGNGQQTFAVVDYLIKKIKSERRSTQ